MINDCRYCGKAILAEDQVYCAYCGKRLVDYVYEEPSQAIDPRLIEIAQGWEEGTAAFCIKVLGLNKRISNSLARARRSPIDVLNVVPEDMIFINNFGQDSYASLDYARKNWEEK